MGDLYESRLKDERQAIPFYDKAVKEIAPAGWEFESVEQLITLRDSLSKAGGKLSKAEAFALNRLIFLQREQRIINGRIAAAAEIRKNRGLRE